MPMVVLSNFLIYCVINAFTPGPGNILALNTVTNYGYKKGKPLFFGIFAGYYVVQIFCAIFVYGVNSLLPNVMEVMKYIGAAYILWLAIHIAFSKTTSENTEQSASFLKGFMLQFYPFISTTTFPAWSTSLAVRMACSNSFSGNS